MINHPLPPNSIIDIIPVLKKLPKHHKEKIPTKEYPKKTTLPKQVTQILVSLLFFSINLTSPPITCIVCYCCQYLVPTLFLSPPLSQH